ncbi:uncharacterized protein MONBRDRAFT_16490, partial [Monosiga brevicollis MX1]
MRGAYFHDHIPRLVHSIMQLVERRGLMYEGIYRVSGSLPRVDKLKAAALMQGPHVLEDAEIPELTSLLKLVLKSMNPPLLTFAAHAAFCRAIRLPEGETRNEALSAALRVLPTKNYRLLDSLMRHLRRVVAECSSNRMNQENIALVFGPTIARSP